MKKVKGFTVLEVMLVMAMAGVFLLITYRVIKMASQITTDKSRLISQSSEILSVRGIFTHDFTKCAIATVNENILKMTFNDREPIYYLFADSGITRSSGLRNETYFNVKIEDKNWIFLTTPVQGGMVDEVALSFTIKGDPLYFNFKKIYSLKQIKTRNEYVF